MRFRLRKERKRKLTEHIIISKTISTSYEFCENYCNLLHDFFVKTTDKSNNELVSRNFLKVRVYYCFSKLWHNVPSLIKFSPWGEANGLASEVKGDLGGLAKRFGMGRINDGEEALRLAEAAKRGCVWWPRGKCVVCSQAAKCLVVVVVPPEIVEY